MNIAIIGATGYSGVELLRFLQHHPHVERCHLYSSSQDGMALSQSFPHTGENRGNVLRKMAIEQIAAANDVVFFATPPGVSSELAPSLIEKGIKVIDLSGDFRLKDGTVYEKWYKRPAAEHSYLQKAVYGLSEWNRTEIRKAQLLANPGCYPTATLLGLAPLVQNGLIEEQSIIVDAKSGVSGAGRKASLNTHFSEINENVKIYKVNEHQHIPEIEQMLKLWNEHIQPITFSTHLIPMTRGIMATIYAQAKVELSLETLLDLYKTSYETAHFVRVRNSGQFPATKEVYGSNYCDIGIAYDERTGRITVVSVIDNLVKGAAGQAVQNFNVMMGWNESEGLKVAPIYP
ncbi:N-acetyl-gamma-glutamyl-phosphate reductase [Anoxybacillus sp. UARK-01]|uniref:N-acetyl-gamma-glutamyl-phosphate reductase n=1 Tax=Anoxybacillus sp. UARK-01 TaxID=1895648 RepID=UPI0009BB4CD2|nr:N-acetyl-gamma-glutamyl-phosphate reductase [Anoxybacillus sp. UARK-01]OQM46592.1 N-acetyl-gamma-glutamyl-phosphate reductase [Anoxybacillus sp. UARK-01]